VRSKLASARHAGKVDAAAIFRKGARKHRLVATIAPEPHADLGLASCHAHFDGTDTEYR
jgi:hypothetical protein